MGGLERPLWVNSSLSISYQANDWFRVYTGHSEIDFLDCLRLHSLVRYALGIADLVNSSRSHDRLSPVRIYYGTRKPPSPFF